MWYNTEWNGFETDLYWLYCFPKYEFFCINILNVAIIYKIWRTMCISPSSDPSGMYYCDFVTYNHKTTVSTLVTEFKCLAYNCININSAILIVLIEFLIYH